jgi:hypothetical protein
MNLRDQLLCVLNPEWIRPRPVLAGHAAATQTQSGVRLVGMIAIAEGKRAT